MADKSKWKKISSGSYGTVYRGYDEIDNKDYAYKESDFYRDSGSIIRELQILSLTDHPNVISLIKFYSQPKFVLVLELAEGNLADYTVTLNKLKFIGYQLVRGLYYLHNRDIIHRDIKPGNILYSECGGITRVMYADFGISQFGSCPYGDQFGDIAFTLFYRAPELLLGGTHSFASDVWALGCCLAEFYLKNIVFVSTDEMGQLMKIFSKLGVPKEDTWPGVTTLPNWLLGLTKIKPDPLWRHFTREPELTDLLKQMLVLNPDDRAPIKDLLNHPYFDSVRYDIETQFPCLHFKETTEYSCKELIKVREISTPDITMSQVHRDILFSWLATVNIDLGMDRPGLFLAYKLFDEIFDHQPSSEYQKIGCSALYIGTDLFNPSVNLATEYVEYSANTFNLNELYDEIFTDLDKVGNKLWQSTPYENLFLANESLTFPAKNLTLVFLILLIIDKHSAIRSNQVLAYAAIYLALLFYDDEIYAFPPNFGDIEQLALEVFLATEDREKRLFGDDFCHRLTGISWVDVSLKINTKINSWQ